MDLRAAWNMKPWNLNRTPFLFITMLVGSLGSLQRKHFKEFKAKWLRMPREMATEAVLVGVLHRAAQTSSVGLLQMFRQWWLNLTGL